MQGIDLSRLSTALRITLSVVMNARHVVVSEGVIEIDIAIAKPKAYYSSDLFYLCNRDVVLIGL